MESEKKSIEEKKRELAIAYAKYLKEHNLQPGDIALEDIILVDAETAEVEETTEAVEAAEPDEVTETSETAEVVEVTETAEVTEITETAETPKTTESKTVKITNKQLAEKFEAVQDAAADPIDAIDRIVDVIDEQARLAGQRIGKAVHKAALKYDSSRKIIGIAVLVVCVLCAAVMIVFDKFTVYEYAYNGKVLGYVDSQDDVTNVLDVASEQLNQVKEDKDTENIEFKANDNVSFKRVKAAGQDTDDADTMVNKLAYMTDIEVEAYGIYDGSNLVSIVKSQEDAEMLLEEVKGILGKPDEGMKLISVEFEKPLEIRPINIMLTSVQSNSTAQEQMTQGGSAKYYHLVEEGETISSIAATFSVKAEDIYNESDSAAVEKIEKGDKVCVHKTTEPVSVKMVETGKMKEIVPFETIEQESADFYIGDTVVGVEGVEGVQIFEGTLTKVGGKVTDRKTKSMEVITEKVDKIIYIGTTKRPKTAPTGNFRNPLAGEWYIITSGVGPRWGSEHLGVDMAAPIGTSVFASDGGTVILAGWSGGYGNCILIEHSNGWKTRYGHLSSIGVGLGEKVYQGQYIGAVGSTGNSTGPHLHFETIHNGDICDPEQTVSGGL